MQVSWDDDIDTYKYKSRTPGLCANMPQICDNNVYEKKHAFVCVITTLTV